MTKTNVMRLLESAGIAYRTAEYEYDENFPGSMPRNRLAYQRNRFSKHSSPEAIKQEYLYSASP